MKDLQKFNFEGNDLAVKEIDGQVYFNAEQAAIGLGLFEKKNEKAYVRWRNVSKYLSQEVAKGDFITEPQFYKLAIKANNPVAEKFQDWVTSEVLPTIRKHGAYMTSDKIDEILSDPDTILKILSKARILRVYPEVRPFQMVVMARFAKLMITH